MNEVNPLFPLVGMLFGGGTVVFVLWTVKDYLTRRQQAQNAAEFHGKLLDRLGSTRDFSEFLNSEGGSRFLDSLALQRDSTPQQRILRSISTGIVLTVLGFGMAILSSETYDPRSVGFAQAIGFLSAVALSLGIGLLVAAFATEKTARRFGLIEGKGGDTVKPPIA